MSYDGAYNAHLNPNKEVVSKVNRYNIGNGKIFSGDQECFESKKQINKSWINDT